MAKSSAPRKLLNSNPTRARLIVTDQSTAEAFDEWQSLLEASEDDTEFRQKHQLPPRS